MLFECNALVNKFYSILFASNTINIHRFDIFVLVKWLLIGFFCLFVVYDCVEKVNNFGWSFRHYLVVALFWSNKIKDDYIHHSYRR